MDNNNTQDKNTKGTQNCDNKKSGSSQNKKG